MSETRDELENVIGARRVGTLEVDGRAMPLALPGTEAEIVELLKLAAAKSWKVLPAGGGTKLDRGAPLEKARFALGTLGLTGVVAYERGDGTITARAGTSMHALGEIARAGGNHLTPDVALARRATLGGVLASGASGFDRLRYGPVRHHVLGMRVLLADGTAAKSGGRLVKNVTGYDLHRLYTGSRGSLCVILEASMRLFPSPERVAVMTASYFKRDSALAAAQAVLASAARPVCVVVDDAGERWRVRIALAGREEPVEWERGAIASILGEHEFVRDEAARADLERLRDGEIGASMRVATPVGRLDRALAMLDEACAVHGLRASLAIHPGIALVHVATKSESSADSIAGVARAMRAGGVEVELWGSSVEARRAFHAEIDAPPAARALMSRLKRALDPENRFASAGVQPAGVP